MTFYRLLSWLRPGTLHAQPGSTAGGDSVPTGDTRETQAAERVGGGSDAEAVPGPAQTPVAGTAWDADNRLLVWLVGFCLVVIGFLTFVPLFHTGFSTADDAWLANLTWANVLQQFSGADGRISHFVTPVVTMVFTWSRDIQFYRLLLIAPQVLNAVLLWILARQLFGYRVAIVATMAYLVSLQDNWQHLLFAAYPFVYQVGFALAITAFLLLLKAERTSRFRYAWMGAALFVLACSVYELFVPYIVVAIAYVAAFGRSQGGTTWQQRIWGKYRYLAPYLILTAVYVVLYFAYRILHPPQYQGVAFSFSLRGFLHVLFVYTLTAIPGWIFIKSSPVFVYAAQSFEPFHRGLGYLLGNLQPDWIVRAAAAGLLMWLFFDLRPDGGNPRRWRSGATTVVLVLVALVPNLLLAMTARHQFWVRIGASHMFTGTYFSLMGLVLLVVLAGYRVLAWYPPRSMGRAVVRTAAVALTVLICLTTDFTNAHIGRVQAHDYDIWRVYDRFLQSQAFAGLPADAAVYAPSMWLGGTFFGLFHPYPVMQQYWANYTRIRTGRTLHIVGRGGPKDLQALLASGKPFYYLAYSDQANTKRPKIVIGAVADRQAASQGRFLASRFDVISMSYNPFETLSFAVQGTGGAPRTVTVDGRGVAPPIAQSVLRVQVKPIQHGSFSETQVALQGLAELRTVQRSFDAPPRQ